MDFKYLDSPRSSMNIECCNLAEGVFDPVISVPYLMKRNSLVRNSEA